MNNQKNQVNIYIPARAKRGEWFKLSDISKTNYISLFAYNLINPIKDYPKAGAGNYIKEGFVEWNNGVGSYHLKRDQFNKTADLLSGFIVNMTKEHKRRVKQYYKLAEKLMIESEKFIKLDFSSMSDNKLITNFKKLAKLQRQNHLIGGILTFLPDEEQQRVSNAIFNKIKDLIKKSGKSLDLTGSWHILTTPRRKSFREIEEEELLKTGIEILKSKKLSKFLKKQNLSETIKNDKYFYNKILKHYKKYRWLGYMYIGPAYNLDYFTERISKIIKEGLEGAEKFLTKQKVKYKTVAIAQEKILENIGAEGRDYELLKFASELVWLKGYRKDTFYYLFYSYEPFLIEVAKRINTVFEFVGFLFPWEFEEALLQKKHPHSELEQRKKRSLYYNDADGIKFYYGKDVDLFKNSVKIEGIEKEVDMLRGMIACPGKANGIVKIIETTDDMRKMNEGDILVSQMTSPDIVPAMKKASAIITNTGGLTCHASILSRELNIPCIVGTKIATRVLKDGDLVEVDAERGIIKVLK